MQPEQLALERMEHASTSCTTRTFGYLLGALASNTIENWGGKSSRKWRFWWLVSSNLLASSGAALTFTSCWAGCLMGLKVFVPGFGHYKFLNNCPAERQATWATIALAAGSMASHQA
jgi:hypothetical protein